jgi:hypothetical protein
LDHQGDAGHVEERQGDGDIFGAPVRLDPRQEGQQNGVDGQNRQADE